LSAGPTNRPKGRCVLSPTGRSAAARRRRGSR
jgi:hypothetical protein